MAEETVLCIQVTRPDSKGRSDKCFYAFSTFDVQAEFDGAEIDDSITLTLIEMPKAEFDNLPEFEGW